MSVRAEFERNRFVLTVDETGCSILNARTETRTTLESWLKSCKRLRLTLPSAVTRIVTFVGLSSLLPGPTFDLLPRSFQPRPCQRAQSG
jgi:hypothetical protein